MPGTTPYRRGLSILWQNNQFSPQTLPRAMLTLTKTTCIMRGNYILITCKVDVENPLQYTNDHFTWILWPPSQCLMFTISTPLGKWVQGEPHWHVQLGCLLVHVIYPERKHVTYSNLIHITWTTMSCHRQDQYSTRNLNTLFKVYRSYWASLLYSSMSHSNFEPTCKYT